MFRFHMPWKILESDLKTKIKNKEKMKNSISLIPFFLLLLFPSFLHSQVPQGIPYQAVIRDNAGAPLVNTPILVRFTLHQNTTDGAIEYQETQSATTNAFGVINTQFGTGTASQGTFAGIVWSNTSKFIQVEANDGNGYVDMGTQQMMSVPYAMYAGNGTSGPAGEQGLSAYQVWLTLGNYGTEQDFINSLRGESGVNGVGIIGAYISQGHFYLSLSDGQLIDAGSYQVEYGCTNVSACNYSPFAGMDDGSCVLPGLPCDDGNSGTYNDLYQSNCQCSGVVGQLGCTNPNACNFNSNAVIDDGSCIIPASSLCNDNDYLTVNDYYDNNCQCSGFGQGSDFEIGAGLMDIDGNHYSTIIINGLEWMAENLRVSHYRNGDPVGYGLSVYQWVSTPWGAYMENHPIQNGKAYNMNAVMDSRQLCPVGWHVASLSDWQNLVNAMNGQTSKLLYVYPNYGAPVTSGMSILMAPDFRDFDGWWPYSLGLWSRTSFHIPNNGAVAFDYGGGVTFETGGMGSYGLHVRCVRN